LGALALELVQEERPSTRARRVAGYLAIFAQTTWPGWSNFKTAPRFSSPAERLAFKLMQFGDSIPRERQLRNVFSSFSAIQAGRDYRISS
jgi:hypothetical protein